MAAEMSFNVTPCCKSRKLPLAILASPPRRGAVRLPSSRRLRLAVPVTRCAPAASKGCTRLPKSSRPVMLPESGASGLRPATRAVAASRTTLPPFSAARASAPSAVPLAETERRKGGTPRAAGMALVMAGLSNLRSKRGASSVPLMRASPVSVPASFASGATSAAKGAMGSAASDAFSAISASLQKPSSLSLPPRLLVMMLSASVMRPSGAISMRAGAVSFT